ncbi:MAG: hypothetical protein ACR2N2_01740 [Acidimicrobiia bacterium]
MRKILLLAVLSLLVAACSGSDPELVGIRASNDPAIGDSRFLFAVNEIDGTRRGSPDEVVTLVAAPLDAPASTYEVTAEFVWIIQDAIGLYKAEIPWDTAGMWEINFEISTGEKAQPFLVFVGETATTVAIGESAPLVATKTLSDTPVEELTTDIPVDERFYELSLDTALTNGNKTVAVFATPAFCTTAACGPMMQQVKAVAGSYDDVNFVHIEVYDGFWEDGFTPTPEALVPAVTAFMLPTEPWIFVMDDEGDVIARLEGVLAPGELEELLDA